MVVDKIGKINVNDPFLGNNKNIVVPGNKINKSIGKDDKVVKKSDNYSKLMRYIIKRERAFGKKKGRDKRQNNQKKSGRKPGNIGYEMFA